MTISRRVFPSSTHGTATAVGCDNAAATAPATSTVAPAATRAPFGCLVVPAASTAPRPRAHTSRSTDDAARHGMGPPALVRASQSMPSTAVVPVVTFASALSPSHLVPAAAARRFPALAALLCGIFLAFSLPLSAVADDEEDSPWIKIEHAALLPTPEFYYGPNWGNAELLTQDQKRKNVGIGETIDLKVEEKKDDTLGDEKNIVWTIEEGDAYFGTKHEEDGLTVKEWTGNNANLNIRVTGAATYTQTVKVKVKTEPAKTDSNGKFIRYKDDKGNDITATVVIKFTRYRPEGQFFPIPIKAVSRHQGKQLPRYVLPKKNRDSEKAERVSEEQETGGYLVGAWTDLWVIPKPTTVNFGGDAEGGVYVMERDGNPAKPLGSSNRPPVNTVPDDSEEYNFLLYYADGLQHVPHYRFGAIMANGGFSDTIYWHYRNRLFPREDSSIDKDHSCEWLCNWFYRDGITARDTNVSGAGTIDNPQTGGTEFIHNAVQKFKLHGRVPNKWKGTVSKFNSTVERTKTGDTGNQTRTGNWPELN